MRTRGPLTIKLCGQTRIFGATQPKMKRFGTESIG